MFSAADIWAVPGSREESCGGPEAATRQCHSNIRTWKLFGWVPSMGQGFNGCMLLTGPLLKVEGGKGTKDSMERGKPFSSPPSLKIFFIKNVLFFIYLFFLEDFI